MSSSTPHFTIDEDDDDGIDWEAAVKEIDIACQRASSASTSRVEEPQRLFVNPPPRKRPICATKQSTLDWFVEKGKRRSTVENGPTEDEGFVGEEGRDEDSGCYSEIDLEAAKTWIYPDNIPRRAYQRSITETALFTNTMVALPTGLGKTLIASVVMYNYFRWFPKGKIVFTAPSRPLVMQQIEACHNIMGIPQEWTIDMTGQLSPSKRAIFWKDKRVFFVTPQVLEKDIQSGTCLVKHLVCLVIDEAHRATGNYSYCVAVRELMAVPVQFRILALTATPGSKQLAIQNVINNLHISKLEYRDESDHEVSPYVNDRKLELITVAMGNDATEINKMIFEAILPFVTRLSALRVLPSRDYQSLSPCDLLNSRDRFRQAPPQDLPQIKYGEVEGYFGVLITLYHIRKLLSSHGIRPAYEMLEEKLQQGSFARLMSRNEVIWKAKLLMQQSLSHGAPSPKLSKMMEILIDHFKANDPKNSRVIIFSNFRGSVRDIMDSLSSIGELVKATEFIGQSSGKTLKGQSQKVQQAVLQKFRAGGYNVIVATSIGEEGLDIMEVDLVICFDANISPLRMIQRMGRTGRKNDGRVVVLACEGTELKGYMRKQASSKSIRKHMHNGGMSSFNFHSSSRMIPHICKPEVKYVEMTIERFIPRSKVKDDSVPRPTFKEKLSYKETELIAKFFHSSGEYSWKPSLISFPHFQTFPSRVYKIMHSFRTGMLIDSMQSLQGLSFSNDGKSLPVEVHTKAPLSQCLGAETTAQDDICENDLNNFRNSPIENSLGRIADHDASATVVLNYVKKQQVPDLHDHIPSTHCFLFGTDFVSVNAFGVVSIASVPNLPYTKDPPCKRVTTNNTELLNSVKQNSFPSRTSCDDKGELDVQTKANLTNPAELRGTNHNIILSPRLCNSDAQRDETLDEVDGMVLLTPSPKRNDVSSDEHVVETPASPRKAFPVSLPDESARDYKDIDMSPRLTNLVEEGVVPESPLADSGGCLEKHKLCKYDSLEQVTHGSISNCPIELQGTELPPFNTLHSANQRSCEVKNLSFSPVLASPASRNDLLSKHAKPEDTENIKACSSTGAKGCMSASINKEIRTPAANVYVCAKAREHISDSPANEEIHTPLVNLTNNCSADWYMSSGEASKSIAQVPKFKRLRKNVESSKRISSKTTNENINGLAANTSRCCATRRPSRMKHMRAKRRLDTHMFIEVEAEVSSDAEVSDDEEEDKENNSSDDSFIDDRLNPTLANTQTEAAGVDMMAVYRRSLLTQSPMEIQSRFSTKFSPGVMPSSRTKSDETGSCTSGKISNSLQTPQTGLHSSNRSLDGCSTSFQRSTNDVSLATLHGETSVTKEQKFESRKRKLSYHQVGYGPESSLQPQRLFHSDDAGQQLLLGQSGTNGLDADVFSDDQFYEDLDLDALEAEATKLLEAKRSKAQNPTTHEKFDLLSSPSFDLGL